MAVDSGRCTFSCHAKGGGERRRGEGNKSLLRIGHTPRGSCDNTPSKKGS